MAEPGVAEVVPKVIIRERIPAAPVTGSAEALAKNIAEKATEGTWREGLEATNKKPVEGRKITEKGEQIGVDRDPATGAKVRTTEEQGRKDKYDQESALIKKFLEVGPNDPSILAAERTRIQNAILARLSQSPTFAAEISALNTAEKKALLERYLKDPAYSVKVRETFDELLDPNNKMIDEESINNATDSVKEKEYERDDKQAEIDDADRRLTSIDTRLKEFERPGGATPMGAKAKEMEDLRGTLPTIRAELATYKTRFEDIEFRLGQLQQERQASFIPGYTGRLTVDIDTEISTERTNFKNAQGEVATKEAKIARLPELEAEEAKLEADKKDIDTEKRERTSEMNKTQLELQKKQRLLEDLKSVRASQEQDLVDGTENIFAEAAGKLIEEQVESATQAYDTELTSLKEQATDQNEQAMCDALRERWLGPERIRRGFLGIGQEKSYRPIDRNQVNNDTDVLLREGPPAGMRRLLMTRINPSTGANYTAVEADAVIANKDFSSKMQPEYVKQLLARRMLVGKMNPEDVHIIVNAPWGQDMINQAIAKNQEFRSTVQTVMGAGSFEKHGFAERFSREIERHPWWLALLLGIPIALGAVGASAAEVERT